MKTQQSDASRNAYNLILTREFDSLAANLASLDAVERKCLISLSLAAQSKVSKAIESLENLDEAERERNAYCREAKLLLEAIDSPDSKRLMNEAETVISLNPKAVFAHRLLGRIFEQQSHFEDALSHYRIALESFPESEKTKLDISKMEIALGNMSDALEMLNKTKPSLKRELYKVSVSLRGDQRVMLLLVLAVLLFNPWTGGIMSLITALVGLVIALYAIQGRDGIILVTSGYFLLLSIPAVGIHLIFNTFPF